MSILNKILSFSLSALILMAPMSTARASEVSFKAGSGMAIARLTGTTYSDTLYAETQFKAPSDVFADIHGSYTDSSGAIVSPYGFVMGDDARSSSGYAFTSITKPQGTTWSSASGLHMVYENNTPIGSCTTNL